MGHIRSKYAIMMMEGRWSLINTRENKKLKYTPESKFIDKFYLITGGLFLLGLSFYLISEGIAWVSLLISGLVTYVSFALARRNVKNGCWIFLGVLSIIFDILNLIATIQLFV